MKEVAPGVKHVKSSPISSNVYLVGRTVIEAGTRLGARALAHRLRCTGARRVLLTHVHPPTHGGARYLCTELGLELWCGRDDVVAAESGRSTRDQPKNWVNAIQQKVLAGPGHPVARALKEGDDVEGFTVLEVPGHSPGHLALWRESDRVLILGDVINSQNVWTGRAGLHEPPAVFTPDPARNRESARRLAALRPSIAIFGHGPVLRDPDALQRFASALPAEEGREGSFTRRR